jgi:hypothetical protein
MSFSYSYARHKIDYTKRPASLAISMAMWIKRYGAKRIAQYGRSRATLNATGHRHRASIHPVLPRWMAWSSILA